MASVDKLLRIEHMVRMSSLVHVVEDIHLQKDQSANSQPCVHCDSLHCVHFYSQCSHHACINTHVCMH